MVIRGEDSTLPVTVEDIAYHTRCVRNGNNASLIMADMPFMSYHGIGSACLHAKLFMQSGANLVKIEGGIWCRDIVTSLCERGVSVCCHIGLTPQSVNVIGGYKVQGKSREEELRLLDEARVLEKAGASLLLLECVPEQLARKITREISIPVIGIGAGRYTDGQILVMHDVLNISSNYIPTFAKDFLRECGSIKGALELYKKEVERGTFPSDSNVIC